MSENTDLRPVKLAPSILAADFARLGGRTVGPAVAWDLAQTFLTAEASHAARHLRCLGKVAAVEAGQNFE